MESTEEIAEVKPKNMYVSICLAQTICIAVILIAILIIKFFFNSVYIKFDAWCKENVLDHVRITAFLQEENQRED